MLHVVIVIVAAEGITNDHAKTLRWGLGCGRIVAVGTSGSIVTDSVKVVGVDSKELDQLELAIPALVVELRLPVLALVHGHGACGLPGVSSIRVGCSEAEIGSSGNGVDVRADLAGEYDGIGSLNRERGTLHDEYATLGLNRRRKGDKHR